MSSTAIDASDSPAVAPLARHGQLEVDAFCSACFYNLHGQLVWIDERLKIPVCRCPECGQHHPAGTGVTAHSIWLRRFSSLLLAVWIVFVLVLAFFACLGLGGMQFAHVNEFSYWSYNNNAVYSNHSLTPPPNYDRDLLAGWGTLILFCLISVAIGFLIGMFLVSVLWHWPPRRYFIGAVLPMISASFVITSLHNDPSYNSIYTWCVQRVLIQASLQCTGIFLGVMFGRKLARQIVRMIIPPKPRQLLAFLWRADGKELPGIPQGKRATPT